MRPRSRHASHRRLSGCRPAHRDRGRGASLDRSHATASRGAQKLEAIVDESFQQELRVFHLGQEISAPSEPVHSRREREPSEASRDRRRWGTDARHRDAGRRPAKAACLSQGCRRVGLAVTDPPGSSAEPALCERAAGPAGRQGWHRMNADWQRLLCSFAVLRRRIVQTLTHWAKSRRSPAGHSSCCRRRSLRSPLACLVQKHSCARGAGHGRTDDSASPKQRTRAGTQTRHPDQAPGRTGPAGRCALSTKRVRPLCQARRGTLTGRRWRLFGHGSVPAFLLRLKRGNYHDSTRRDY